MFSAISAEQVFRQILGGGNIAIPTRDLSVLLALVREGRDQHRTVYPLFKLPASQLASWLPPVPAVWFPHSRIIPSSFRRSPDTEHNSLQGCGEVRWLWPGPLPHLGQGSPGIGHFLKGTLRTLGDFLTLILRFCIVFVLSASGNTKEHNQFGLILRLCLGGAAKDERPPKKDPLPEFSQSPEPSCVFSASELLLWNSLSLISCFPSIFQPSSEINPSSGFREIRALEGNSMPPAV